MGHHLAWPLVRRDVAGRGNVGRGAILRNISGGIAAALVVGALAAAPVPASAQSGEPIKIGFSMALTGPLAPNGKQALLGAKIWEEEINAKGGLLGRKVQLINYDDQIQPGDGAGHLHQAPRRRQGRSRGRALCDQHERAGDAGRHAEGQDLHQPVRARC